MCCIPPVLFRMPTAPARKGLASDGDLRSSGPSRIRCAMLALSALPKCQDALVFASRAREDAERVRG
eukprot:2772528-Alexandrium_andersonii.AAC.3